MLGELRNQLFGFTRSSAITYCDQRDMMPIDEILQRLDGALPIVLRFMGVDRARIEEFAGGIHNGNLAASAKTGVYAKDNLIRERRLAEQRSKSQ